MLLQAAKLGKCVMALCEDQLDVVLFPAYRWQTVITVPCTLRAPVRCAVGCLSQEAPHKELVSAYSFMAAPGHVADDSTSLPDPLGEDDDDSASRRSRALQAAFLRHGAVKSTVKSKAGVVESDEEDDEEDDDCTRRGAALRRGCAEADAREDESDEDDEDEDDDSAGLAPTPSAAATSALAGRKRLRSFSSKCVRLQLLLPSFDCLYDPLAPRAVLASQ